MSQKFMVETSARHVHVTDSDLEKLFGAGYKLTVKKELSQPGQFASNEKVEVVGPKGSLKCSILGPTRKETQVELSKTDARTVGITAPVRESGELEGSAGCTIKGPAGEITIDKGVIIAKRHIHLTPADAEELGVKDKDVVWVKVETEDRSAVLGDTVVRVSDSYRRAMHIDTDESNAISAANGLEGEIIKL
ncbi:MAG: phosphate propanoyltransferase [Oscillospiraceae bacterium]|nr:phosphate propanoyltransferase [Oscillospiraceae bacterium]